MRKLLLLATAICGLALPASAAPIDGDINFDGSDSYNSTTVTFLGAGQGGVQRHRGAGDIRHVRVLHHRYQHHLQARSAGNPVNNFLSGTNGAIHFALDLLSVFNVQFQANANEPGF